MARSITALVTDLIFATKITSTASTLGIDAHVVRTLDGLRERLQADPDTFVFIDLNATGVDPLEAVRLTRTLSPPPLTIAYVSHVQAELAEAARQAGADDVMPRSAFSAKLPALLHGLKERSDEA